MSIFAIKIVALAAMLLDHTYKVFGTDLYTNFQIDAELTTLIGRIAFPLFAFAFAEGCRKTKHSRKRFLRLTVFAVLSEPCYHFAQNINNRIRLQQGGGRILWFIPGKFHNVLFTFLLTLIFITWVKKSRPKTILKCSALMAVMLLAEMLGTDYGGWGVLLTAALYFCKNTRQSALLLFLWNTLFYLGFASWNGSALMWWGAQRSPYYIIQWLFACAAILPVYFYNGKAGRKSTWLFYVFYPSHLLALALIREIIYRI